jgi:hypothetical protein
VWLSHRPPRDLSTAYITPPSCLLSPSVVMWGLGSLWCIQNDLGSLANRTILGASGSRLPWYELATCLFHCYLATPEIGQSWPLEKGGAPRWTKETIMATSTHQLCSRADINVEKYGQRRGTSFNDILSVSHSSFVTRCSETCHGWHPSYIGAQFCVAHFHTLHTEPCVSIYTSCIHQL